MKGTLAGSNKKQAKSMGSPITAETRTESQGKNDACAMPWNESRGLEVYTLDITIGIPGIIPMLGVFAFPQSCPGLHVWHRKSDTFL